MKNLNKKFIAIIVVLAVALGGIWIYDQVFNQGEEGSKEVTINVIAEEQDINFSGNYKTDEEFLQGLLEEKKDDLNVVSKDSEYGPMIIGLKGYEVDESKEYYHISIDGVDSMTGVKEIPVKDGAVYTFEVKGF